MSDELVKRSRDVLIGVTDGPWEAALERGCHGIIAQSLPQGGANFVAMVGNDADTPEKEPSRFANARFMAASRELVPAMADRIEELEAKLAKAVDALEAWTVLLDHCSIEEGVCCCGEDMEGHSHPMNCGHSPVDHGAYVATNLYERTRAVLAEIKEKDDE